MQMTYSLWRVLLEDVDRNPRVSCVVLVDCTGSVSGEPLAVFGTIAEQFSPLPLSLWAAA